MTDDRRASGTPLTHASFFSGGGGVDLGLERAGWDTVSFSEIDPYAAAIIAERWPGVPNLGDITELAHGRGGQSAERTHPRGAWRGPEPDGQGDRAGRSGTAEGADGWESATLWSAGFPCQDLSVAGKRAGLAGERSGLAFAFLDLVGRHRPRAVLLENVPGLLSSHGGRDLARLLGEMVELGYGVAYRVLDAQFLGVPQRRRRVFILGLRSGDDDPDGRAAAERAAEVLSVGARCRRDHQAEREARARAAAGLERGAVADGGPRGVDEAHLEALAAAWIGTGGAPGGEVGHAGVPGDNDARSRHLVGTQREHVRPGSNTDHSVLVGTPSPDPDGVRAPDGLAGRAYGGGGLASALGTQRGGADDNDASGRLVAAAFVKARRAAAEDGTESWGRGDVMATLNAFDVGDVRTTALAFDEGSPVAVMDPDGLDSNRYRICGNGVVAPVAEWLGRRLRAYMETMP